MQRLSLLAACLVLGLTLVWPQSSRAADDAERIKFDTYDQVELHGTFYPGGKGNKSPCALLLHAIGGNSQQEGWEDLARKLQAEHYAVLSFDFRGHGDSTTVGPGFWNVPSNRSLKGYRPLKPKDQISYKDFTTVTNFLDMVNDIAAAKRELERRNDSGDCNCANIVLIGSESGATLGALWIWSEFQRRRIQLGLPIMPQRGQLEGQDIAGAVWLSITPQFGIGNQRWTVNADGWLRSPVRERVPMYFLYGEKDTRAANYAKHLVDTVLHADRDSRMKLTGKMPIKDTKLAGIELLGKASLTTGDLIQKYVKRLVDDRGLNPWTKRDVDRTILARVPLERLR
jgi:pimeloyl-ACP methyl ester carboxylesterase